MKSWQSPCEPREMTKAQSERDQLVPTRANSHSLSYKDKLQLSSLSPLHRGNLSSFDLEQQPRPQQAATPTLPSRLPLRVEPPIYARPSRSLYQDRPRISSLKYPLAFSYPPTPSPTSNRPSRIASPLGCSSLNSLLQSTRVVHQVSDYRYTATTLLHYIL